MNDSIVPLTSGIDRFVVAEHHLQGCEEEKGYSSEGRRGAELGCSDGGQW